MCSIRSSTRLLHEIIPCYMNRLVDTSPDCLFHLSTSEGIKRLTCSPIHCRTKKWASWKMYSTQSLPWHQICLTCHETKPRNTDKPCKPGNSLKKDMVNSKRDVPWIPNKIIGDNILICVTQNASQWPFRSIPLFERSNSQKSCSNCLQTTGTVLKKDQWTR